MSPRGLIRLGALTCGFSLCASGCSRKAQADEVCSIARAVSADDAIDQEDKFFEWMRRSVEYTKRGPVHDAFYAAAQQGSVEPEVLEAAISEAIGEPWRCQPIRELAWQDETPASAE